MKLRPIVYSIDLNCQNLNIPSYSLDTSTVEIETDDPFEQNRYFKLELDSPDFGHDLYPIVLNSHLAPIS